MHESMTKIPRTIKKKFARVSPLLSKNKNFRTMKSTAKTMWELSVYIETVNSSLEHHNYPVSVQETMEKKILIN